MAQAKKLPSGTWRVLVYSHTDIVGGKKVRRYESFTADEKNEAEYLAAEYARNKKRRNSPAALLFKEALENYIEDKSNILSPSTIRGYKTAQRNCFGYLDFMPLKKIDEIAIQKQININSAEYSAKSIKNQIGLISAVCKKYKLGIDFEQISTKPKEKKEILIPTEEHMRIIIEKTKDTNIEIPVLLAGLQGLRQSEIAACEWERIKENVLQIKGAIVPDENHKLVQKDLNKSYAGTRNVILVDYVAKRFGTLRSFGKMSSMTPSSILRKLKIICSENGLPEYTMHSLRHFHASVMLMLNIPDKYAMDILGQNSPHMLKATYQHIFSDEFLKVNEKINEHYKFLN